MITIRTHFFQITFDNKKEYAIYHDSYIADAFGQPLPEECGETYPLEESCVYGNIIIETEIKRYYIKSIPKAYQWVVELLDYINARKDQEDIFVDMDMLMPSGDGEFYEFDCLGCDVEKL